LATASLPLNGSLSGSSLAVMTADSLNAPTLPRRNCA
jgi:hypothetical protein